MKRVYLLLLLLNISALAISVSEVYAENRQRIISGEFKNTKLRTVLALLGEVTGKNFFALEQEEREISCPSTDRDLKQLYDCISQQLAMNWREEDGIIIFGTNKVSKNKLTTSDRNPIMKIQGPLISVRLNDAPLNPVLSVLSKLNTKNYKFNASTNPRVTERFYNISAGKLLELLKLKYIN
jgi:hypothetical protein